jgi:hypothetical protein
VIFAFQQNNNTNNDVSDRILEMFQKYQLTFYKSSIIPTVKDIRGKVWIFGGYGIRFRDETYFMAGASGVTDNVYIYRQNHYQISDWYVSCCGTTIDIKTELAI